MKRLTPGQSGLPLNASTWNGFVDAASYHKRNTELGDPKGENVARIFNDRVTVENLTGANLRRGEVVELGDLLLNDLRPEHPWFEGLSVDLSANRHTFGVMLRPTLEDKFGKCLLIGECIAHVDIQNVNHQYAELANGASVLSSAVSGPARILWKPPAETGEQECWVLLGDDGPLSFVGKATEAIAKGTSGVCAIWSGTPGSETDTGLTVTAFNRVSDVASGDWLSLTKVIRHWYLAPLECPEEE